MNDFAEWFAGYLEEQDPRYEWVVTKREAPQENATPASAKTPDPRNGQRPA